MDSYGALILTVVIVLLANQVVMRAGQRVDVVLKARDVFGNMTVWGEQRVAVEAQGAVAHEFDEEVFLNDEGAPEQVRIPSRGFDAPSRPPLDPSRPL